MIFIINMKEFLQNHWIEITALVISIASAMVAVISWRLSANDFMLTHRPFLWVENFSYLDSQGKVVKDLKTIQIKVLNSPAEIITAKYEYYSIDKNGNKNSVDEYEGDNNSFKYPSDKMQYTSSSIKITDSLIRDLKSEENLFRFIRIEYKWLSSDKKYFFEGKWKYNKVNKIWDIEYQKAD